MTSNRRSVITAWGARPLVALAGVGALVAVTAMPASAEATTTNACRSNITGAYTDIDITIGGTLSGSTLSGTTLSLAFPADLFISGYNLGLIQDGDEVPGDIDVTVAGSNTSEGTFEYPTQTSSAVVSINDPDATAGTGDETAEALSLSFTLPDTTWTSTGGTVELTQQSAFISAAVGGGLIEATFDCVPGLSKDDDGDGENETFTTQPAAAFASGAGGGTTTPTTAATEVLGTQQTAGDGDLATTGSSSWLLFVTALALVNIGYLTVSSTWAPRQRVRS